MRGEDWVSHTGEVGFATGLVVLCAVAIATLLLFQAAVKPVYRADRYEVELSQKYGKTIKAPKSNELRGEWTIDGEKRVCTVYRKSLKMVCEEAP